MPFLKRFFPFNDKKVETLQSDKRIYDRYPISKEYPLEVFLAKENFRWPMEVINVSLGGLRIKFPEKSSSCLPSNAMLLDKEYWSLNINLSGYGVTVLGSLLYTDVRLEKNEFCVSFKLLPDDKQKIGALISYYHVIFPVLIGNSLKELPAQDVQQMDAQYRKRMFTGVQGCVASIWYPLSETGPLEFEILMEDFVIRGNKNGKLEFFLIPNSNIAQTKEFMYQQSPIHCAIKGNDEKWAYNFFQWIVLHLSLDFPSEILCFFKSYLKK